MPVRQRWGVKTASLQWPSFSNGPILDGPPFPAGRLSLSQMARQAPAKCEIFIFLRFHT